MGLSGASHGRLITMRHEEKYICSMRQLKLIEQRLKAVMPYDTNQEGDSYSIRSLYLDTGDDRFYYEGLSGVNHRSKYRIRFYNMNDGVIRLERKDSDGNLKKKKSEKISKDQVLRLLDGGLCIEDVGDLGMEVHSLMRGEGLHPAVIIEYKRSAFVYPVGNVRITLDRDISYSPNVGELFDTDALMIPVMPQNMHVLEVKYDGIIPGYLLSLLETGSLERVSYSKYVYARDTMSNNGVL